MQALKNLFSSKDKRTRGATINSIISIIIKGGSIVLNFSLVPVTLSFLDQERYGIWITLSSIVGWFSFFDIGLGNGLRIQFAVAKAKDDFLGARKYVSTTYVVITIISIIAVTLLLISSQFINWRELINAKNVGNNELNSLVSVVFIMFGIRFVLQLILTVLSADQKPAYTSVVNFLANLTSLLLFLLFKPAFSGSLINVSLALLFPPIVLLVVLSLYCFYTKYKIYRPSLKHYDKKIFKSLTGMGIKFFIIQISAIVIFETSTFIISRLYGPAAVTPYQIAFRYFSIITFFFGVITAPYISAFTEAWTKNDDEWILKSISLLKKIWIGVTIGGMIMLIISPKVYELWVGKNVVIPFSLSLCIFIYTIASSFGSIYVLFINGVGKVFLQFLTSIICIVLFIPLAILLSSKLYLGISGIVIATVICNFYGPFIAPVQFNKIINKSDKGMWGR